jgi:nitrogen PTS system EIIA component
MRKNENLTTEEVAELLGLPLVTIQRWEHQGKIPSKIVKHKKCFKRKEILEWAKDHDFSVKTEDTDGDVTSNQILSSAIKRGGIYNDIPGKDIVEVLGNALNVLPFLSEIDHNLILNEMLDREEMASTGIGHGIAIPHTRERNQIGSEQIFVPALFLKNQIEFNAIDGDPVSVLFMIFTGNTKDHLTVLSRISHALKERKVLNILNEKNKRNNLLTQISKIEQDFYT